MHPENPLDVVRRYFDAIERKDRSALEGLIHPEIVQREFPNRLVVSGAVRDRAALFEAFERGKTVLTSESYVVQNALVSGEKVAVEVAWTGKLAIPVGNLAAGQSMTGTMAMFFEVRGGRIARQHNYDCFEPF